MSNLIRCQNGHMFSGRRYGTICPYCNIETATREKKETGQTEIMAEESLFLQEERPVCGWIVCVEGPRKGKDYKIVAGKNFVGRADDMDIQILGDNQISRRNHCVIVYDEKKEKTLILPGDSNGMVYLGDDAVYEPTALTAYGVIEMGESKFVFIPFCGEYFTWKE